MIEETSEISGSHTFLPVSICGPAREFMGSIQFRQSTIPGKIQGILFAVLFWGITIMNVKLCGKC